MDAVAMLQRCGAHQRGSSMIPDVPPVPPALAETEEERRRFADAERRRAVRLEHRELKRARRSAAEKGRP